MDRHSKALRGFAHNLVVHYAKFDKLSQCYTLSIDDIEDFDLHEFASIFMQSNDDCASEATGYDNPAYEKTMLPALLKYLQNTTNKDNEIEFNNAWRDGIASYFKSSMQELLDECCSEQLQDSYNALGLYSKKHSDNGEIYWSRNL